MDKVSEFGTQRNYTRVFFLSVATLGIYYFLYQYWLFEDLQEHYHKAFSYEPKSFPTIINPTTMLIFLIIFPLYPIYMKYSLLHNHIETTSIKTENNCAIGINAVLSVLILGICTIGILPLLNEYRWQKAFNEHIIAHDEEDAKQVERND